MIYVLVPAYNEAATVGLLLWKVRQLFTSFNREYQLIVVNDGSTDATDEILAPYTRALPLTLITHRNRQGYARSLEVLLREAVKRTDRPKRDLAVTLQADFSESPEEVLELLKKLEGGADIVIADRRRRIGATATERMARTALAAVTRRKLGVGGADDLVGTMRGYRIATVQRLIKEHGDTPFLGQQGWAADLELLARAARHARTIESVVVPGQRTEASRPSRLHPIAEAWRAWRAASALVGLPKPVLSEGATPVEQAERTDDAARQAAFRGREHDRHDRHERPERGERHGRGERRDRNDRRGGSRGGKKRQAEHSGPRLESSRPETPPAPQAEPQAPAPEVVEAPVAMTVEASGTQAAGEGARKRRRRRGRGRGRGRGPGAGPRPQEQTQPLPPSPPPSAA